MAVATKPRHEPLLALIAPTVAFGLWLDAAGDAGARAVVTVWVWGLFAWLIHISDRSARRAFLACLGLATAGELLLSEALLVYEYDGGFLPAYVPPGHCLLYFLGTEMCRRLPRVTPRWQWGLRLAFIGSTVGFGLMRWPEDQAGYAAALGVALMVAVGKARALYGVMACLSLVMELWGTWLGVWTWSATLPATGWTLANPPLGVGVLYCALDALVLLVASPGSISAPTTRILQSDPS